MPASAEYATSAMAAQPTSTPGKLTPVSFTMFMTTGTTTGTYSLITHVKPINPIAAYNAFTERVLRLDLEGQANEEQDDRDYDGGTEGRKELIDHCKN